MFKPRISSRLRRLVATGVATMLIGSALAGSVSAKGSVVSLPPVYEGGWYGFGIIASIDFDVDPQTPLAEGAYIERITVIDCEGTDGAHFQYPDLPRQVDTHVSVFLSNNSQSLTGTDIQCTATYERAYGNCVPFFGCLGYHSFEFAGEERATATVKIDLTPPTNVVAQASSAPNFLGWYRTAGTVDWFGFDFQSGIHDCSKDVPFGGTDTATGKALGGCRNNAGVAISPDFTYKFDGTVPELAPTVSPNPVGLNGSATASPNATDNLSGIAAASCGAVDTSTVGSHSVACQATDKAGNTTIESVDYTVAYTFAGFDAPVDNGAVNIAKAGRAIPLKWRVTDGSGNPVTTLSSVTVRATALACDLGDTADQLEEYASGLSGLQNLGDGYYQFNWTTPKSYASSCKTFLVDLGDGLDHTAEFRFVK